MQKSSQNQMWKGSEASYLPQSAANGSNSCLLIEPLFFFLSLPRLQSYILVSISSCQQQERLAGTPLFLPLFGDRLLGL